MRRYSNSRVTESSVVKVIDESVSFEVETDASNSAIAAVLIQAERSVGFLFGNLTWARKTTCCYERGVLGAIIKTARH